MSITNAGYMVTMPQAKQISRLFHNKFPKSWHFFGIKIYIVGNGLKFFTQTVLVTIILPPSPNRNNT